MTARGVSGDSSARIAQRPALDEAALVGDHFVVGRGVLLVGVGSSLPAPGRWRAWLSLLHEARAASAARAAAAVLICLMVFSFRIQECAPRVSPARRPGISRVSARLTASRREVDSRSMGIAVLGPLEVDGQGNGLEPAGPGGALGAGRARRRPDQHRGAGRRAVGRRPARVVGEGRPRVRRAPAEAAGRRRHRVRRGRLPADGERGGGGQPALRAAVRARPGGPGRGRPGADVVPGAGGAGPVARAGAGRPGGVGAGAGGGGAARRDCGWTPRSCAWRPRPAPAMRATCWNRRGPWSPRRRFRERRWALLATALHQAGRQAEALAALKQARAMLVDELGLDPGRELVELEQQLLRQDPSLDPVVGAGGQRQLPLPRPAALRRRGRRLVLRQGGRRRRVPAEAAGLGRAGGRRDPPASASRRWSAPGSSPHWSAAAPRSW